MFKGSEGVKHFLIPRAIEYESNVQVQAPQSLADLVKRGLQGRESAGVHKFLLGAISESTLENLKVGGSTKNRAQISIASRTIKM